MDEHAYLIRYGVMGHVARFRASPECGGSLGRGQAVVIQTDRGIELGEVLVLLEELASVPSIARQSVLRPAAPEDLARSRHAESIRDDRFTLCQSVLREGDWPWELIDVEPMLDDRATVLHYLGPHQLDAATLRARFRMTCDFDVVLEPVGIDAESEGEGDAWEDAPDGGHQHGGCGSCGSGGGCGSRSGSEHEDGEMAGGSASGAAGCGTSPHSGCASCGISRMLAGRGERKTAADT